MAEDKASPTVLVLAPCSGTLYGELDFSAQYPGAAAATRLGVKVTALRKVLRLRAVHRHRGQSVALATLDAVELRRFPLRLVMRPICEAVD